MQIRSIKPGDEMARFAKPELSNNISANKGSSRCRQRNHLRTPNTLAGLPKPQIIRSEIVPPLRNTVSFVDREKADLGIAQDIAKPFAAKSLRRYIEQLIIALPHFVQARSLLFE